MTSPDGGRPAGPPGAAPGDGRTALGARVTGDGTRFALWAPRAERVELALVDADRRQHNTDLVRAGDGTWSVHVPGVGAGQRYGYRVHGAWDPDSGQRFNPAKLLLDPYARAITAGVDYSGPIFDHRPDDDFLPDPTDSFAAVPLAVVVGDTPPPRPVDAPTPLERSVIYEVHLRGFTRLHPAVPEHLRGTYAGMAYPAVIDYLKGLGVTAIELLPVHHFVSEPFLIGRGLSNYWGYNSLGFFAPHAAYSSDGTTGQQVTEFAAMVDAYHRAGIEVLLDVVYNHTGEGGNDGPTLAFRGIDHAGYYRLTDDLRSDYDVTGCGNSVDTSSDGVLGMIMDSLRYWVTEMGVDGFRFDLATTLVRDRDHHVVTDGPFMKWIAEDPVLSKVKLIAEPWDVGPYGYQVGRFGPGWSEWNDQYRGGIRDHWRGHAHGVQELAERLCGSPSLFAHDRRPVASINFVTAHDGMTLRDLVSYNDKHNEANGEHNRDGSDDNRSWNCGIEGPSDDPTVTALRRRQIKNLMTTLVLSAGVPMITAGDEFGRTQDGNNNAYCQDSPISWVHWDPDGEWADVTELTRTLLALRAEHPCLRPERYRHGDPMADAKDLAWFNERGEEMTQHDWADGGRRLLGMYVRDEASAFCVWFHSGAEPVGVRLPGPPWSHGWTVRAHTGAGQEFTDVRHDSTALTVPGHTVLVLQADLG